jgi:hypothetical protein
MSQGAPSNPSAKWIAEIVDVNHLLSNFLDIVQDKLIEDDCNLLDHSGES